MASLAYSMAIASPNVRADVIEITEFPELALKYGVVGVPLTVINEGVRLRGALSQPNFLEPVIKEGMSV